MIIKSNNLLKFSLLLFILFIYIICLSLFDWDLITAGYRLTAVLPVCYLFCFFFFLWNPVFKKRSPFVILFCIIAFVRYVMLSILILNGSFQGISGIEPSEDNLTLAAYLMIYELVLVSVFIFIWSKKYIPDPLPIKNVNMQKQPYIYLAFIMITCIGLLVIPEATQGLSFFGNINRGHNEGNLFILGIRECFINAKYFLLFVIIMVLSKYGKNRTNINIKKYIFLLIVAILIIGIRIGTNRKRFLADALAIFLLLSSLYPQYKKITFISLFGAGIFLFACTTLYRGMIDSYGDFMNDFFDVGFFQAYFLGQYNVAIAIEAYKFSPDYLSIKTLIYEVFRPIFGIGSLIKNMDIQTAGDLFNFRISLGLSTIRNDQIIPLIGQGYMYLGFIFSPLFSILFSRLGIYCDKLYRNSNQIEVIFLASYISFYLAQFMALNGTIILNNASFLLAIFIPVFALSMFFNQLIKKKHNHTIL